MFYLSAKKKESCLKSNIKLKSIVLIFENCEICEIPHKAIRSFQIHSEISMLEERNLVEECLIESLQIKKKWLKKNYAWLGNGIKNKSQNLLERLRNTKDITKIEFYFETPKIKRVYSVPWDDNNEYENSYQKMNETFRFVDISITNGIIIVLNEKEEN